MEKVTMMNAEAAQGKRGPKQKFPDHGNMHDRSLKMPTDFWEFAERQSNGKGAADYVRQLVANAMQEKIARK